jgi:TRAP-type C4-dicarboxylate transport system permease small subunit
LTPSAAAPEAIDPDTPRLLRPLARLLFAINRAMVLTGMLALLAASCVLTYSVLSRYVMKASTDWQDETAVFCLVGATFLSGAFVQARRGHIGIEVMSTLLSDAVNRLRQAAIDLMCTLFCAFFAWKSWTLFHEAWVDKQTTSSSWAPPLWIPYVLMSAGMTLLCLQLFVQFSASTNRLVKKTNKETA